MSKEIIITQEYNGTSPKSYLKKLIDLPYFQTTKLIKDKRITLNGKKIRDQKLSTGDVIKVWKDDIPLRVKEVKKIESKDLGIPLIFENEDFLVLNKLPGIVVQGAQDNDTSLSYHLEYLRIKNKDSSNYMHVHRLDKDTSGVLVIGKNLVALRELNRVFRERNIIKKYVCLCVGRFEKSKGIVDVYLKRAPEGSSEKMQVVDKSDNEAKLSISEYEVIDEFSYKDLDLSLVEVVLKTGLTHQIRVHMKYLGCPIICDTMYGNSYANRTFEGVLNRQFLHAKSIELNYKDKKFKFEAPLTKDLKEVMELLNV